MIRIGIGKRWIRKLIDWFSPPAPPVELCAACKLPAGERAVPDGVVTRSYDVCVGQTQSGRCISFTMRAR